MEAGPVTTPDVSRFARDLLAVSGNDRAREIGEHPNRRVLLQSQLVQRIDEPFEIARVGAYLVERGLHLLNLVPLPRLEFRVHTPAECAHERGESDEGESASHSRPPSMK